MGDHIVFSSSDESLSVPSGCLVFSEPTSPGREQLSDGWPCPHISGEYAAPKADGKTKKSRPGKHSREQYEEFVAKAMGQIDIDGMFDPDSLEIPSFIAKKPWLVAKLQRRLKKYANGASVHDKGEPRALIYQ